MLLLGGCVDMPQLRWHDDPALPCVAVLLVGEVSAADLAAATEVMPDPAVPVADFAGNHTTRHDFAATALDAPALAMALAQFTPVIRRLSGLPFRAARQDRGDLLILRLAWSRDNPIEACFTPASPNVIDYPQITCHPPKRVALERLACRGLLQRRHFMRAYACDHCASHRLLAFEACRACGGSDLADEAIIHHYRCGCQQAESGFVHGMALVCPKCRRDLRHIGVDYSKSGLTVRCRHCGACSPEPDPRFACLDCAAVISGQQAASVDWFHYDLTDAGMVALRNGRLPDDSATTQPDGAPAPRSMRDFRLLATAALRCARKFARPFTLARLTPTNLAALRGRYGVAAFDDTLQQASAVIARALSDSEFVTADDGTVLIGFPDTAASNASSLVTAACAAVAARSVMKIDFDVVLRESDAAAEFLGPL
jgi:Thaumarchaeal output domain 1